MTLILGIDPGKTGGIAVLNKDALTVETWPMPGTTQELHDLIAGTRVVAVR